MKAINRKLWRDLWRMKGQVAAIMLVVMSGVAAFIMPISTVHSLDFTRNRFYEDYNFADIFVELKRAPESIKDKIKDIEGVKQIEIRVSAHAKLSIKGFSESVTGRIVSIPDDGNPRLNRLYIRKGRLVDSSKDNEAVINETFAEAHGLNPGDTIAAVINGKWKKLTIVGIALSPEFIALVKPGATQPDFKRYGLLWMSHKAISKAFDMEGAFNNVVLTLYPGADENDVLRDLDNILERYGSLGAYGRKDQQSSRLLDKELEQLRKSAKIYPLIFIFVAAFLLNVVMSRTINTQREQIATLKAFGYKNIDVAIHYVKLIVLIISGGFLGGIVAGIVCAHILSGIYLEVYRFPAFIYKLNPELIIIAFCVITIAALAGAMHALWKAAKQPPAEAMRPEAPAKYRVTLIEKTGIGRFMTQPSRIIARNVERKPIRTFLSIVGIALACATIISSGFFHDAVDYMVNAHFIRAQNQDVTVSFVEPTSYKAIYELKRTRGINDSEPFRIVPVKLKFGYVSYKTIIQGIEPNNRLCLLMDGHFNSIPLPPSGILLTDYLGTILGVKVGDMLTVEALEGSKSVRQVPVVALPKQYLHVAGYMNLSALNRLMNEGDAISGAYLVTDSYDREKLFQKFTAMPRVYDVVIKQNEINNFYNVLAKGMLFFTFIAMLMACFITFGVVYNSAIISLSERARELSSLRVLGYTRGEIAYILLGELGMITLAAIPLGFIIGYFFCAYIAQALGNDIFRVPLIIELKTYAQAAAVVLLSAIVSGLIVRRKLDRLDLVAVLKIRE